MQKQLTLTKKWNYNIFARILYSYFRWTGRLFLRCALFVARYSITRPSWETKTNNDQVTEKIHSLFLTANHSFYIIFYCFLCLLPPASQATYLLNGPYIDTLLGMVFCLMISWVNGWNYENLLQFNTSWLVFLRTWYYFRLCFRFSHSGYDLTLVKEIHTLTYKLVVGNCGGSIYHKTKTSEKAISFLSLMSFSINKASQVIHR